MSGLLGDAHGRPAARSGTTLDAGRVTRVDGTRCWIRPYDGGVREVGPCQLPTATAAGHPAHETHPADPVVTLTPAVGDEVLVVTAAGVAYAIPYGTPS